MPSSNYHIRLGLLIAGIIALFFVIVLAPNPARRFDNLEIRGSKPFQGRVARALGLLKSKSPDTYSVLTNNVRLIAQAERSGMAAYLLPPTMELTERSVTYSITDGAGNIAHEAFHSKLYHDFQQQHPNEPIVPDEVWMGEAAEKQCVEYQQGVLRAIGAPASEIQWYTWNPTNRYWEVPYDQRNW